MHTYSIYTDGPQFNLDWIGQQVTTYHVRCSCGVESGQSHLTVESAHREPIHTQALNSRRYLPVAQFDGQIITRSN